MTYLESSKWNSLHFQLSVLVNIQHVVLVGIKSEGLKAWKWQKIVNIFFFKNLKIWVCIELGRLTPF